MSENKKYKIKKGDKVIVIAGKDKGSKGEILKVITKEDRVLVAGVNVAITHKKPTNDPAKPSGIVKKELPIHISNVALFDEKSSSASKVKMSIDEKGKKIRVYKKSGEEVK